MKLRDLDQFDDALDEHFSDDRVVRMSVALRQSATLANSVKEVHKDPALKKQRGQAISKAFADNYDHRVDVARKIASDLQWKEKTLANIMSRARPVVDLEANTIHESLTDVARYYGKAVGTIQWWMKSSKTETFYYTTREEYLDWMATHG